MSVNFPRRNMRAVPGADRPDSETSAPSRGNPGGPPGLLAPDMMTPAQSAFDQRLAQGSSRTLDQWAVRAIPPSGSLPDETVDPLSAEPPASPDHWDLGLFQSPIPDGAALPYEVDHGKDWDFRDEIGAADPGSQETTSPSATPDGPSPPGTPPGSVSDFIISGTSPRPASTDDNEMSVAAGGRTGFIDSTIGAAIAEFSRIANDPDLLKLYYSDSIKDRMIASFPDAPFLPPPVINKALLPSYRKELEKALEVSGSDFEEVFSDVIVDIAEETAQASDVILDEIDSHYSTLGSSDRAAIFRGALEKFGELVNSGKTYDDARDLLANATHVVAALLQRSDESGLSDGDAPTTPPPSSGDDGMDIAPPEEGM
jgi:hypothetical protein